MERIVQRTLHQEVTERIREMIRTGVLVRGQKIDEKQISESMGVSRTPVRESLRILHSEGLVDLIPHKGAYLTQPRVEEIQDMFEVISVLEGTCARLAAKKMTKEELKELESLHGTLERRFRKRNHKAYLECNHLLHLRIQQLSGNKVLKDMLNSLRQKEFLHRQRQLYHKDRFERSIEEHRDIIEALKKRNPDLAERAMKRHLIHQCEALVDMYADKKRSRERRTQAPANSNLYLKRR
jgi:DNA-binding GntR family transcriptional regulator